MAAHLIILGQRTAEEVLEAVGDSYKHNFQKISRVVFDSVTWDDFLENEVDSEHEVYFHVGIAQISLRKSIVEVCEARGFQPFTIIHPAAVVSPTAKIGKGVFVAPLAVVSSHAQINDYSLIHIHASVGHDANVGQYCNVLPGARISGNATVNDGCLIGSNAFVNAGITIGENSQVDALTYVARDLPPNMLLSVRSNAPLPRIPLT